MVLCHYYLLSVTVSQTNMRCLPKDSLIIKDSYGLHESSSSLDSNNQDLFLVMNYLKISPINYRLPAYVSRNLILLAFQFESV